ncbi:hypothetical protein [Aureimonas phyllosphaerae]|uniref:Uncharacterized protein n=1 Tax=Aureimonas phyllosphaerae TaxID=1166078 RepID=A0A7W6FXB8_9HYPH|nr:hypothetical protein [Aureimonas phyllosphaerae]MBB3937952.1 hypothetical protein [Aureimonas phyllosphaerae]MBB3961874.1 hypothetical protein [Aureimonas phyllosphaerae]SFF54378.1 hypothetical protein SAMN05216566_1253 [Aureimonas phyllosphaerae]
MAKQRYIVVPGILFVAGAPVPLDRIVNLTPEEARFDLLLGRIYLDGTQPPITPVDPVQGGDVVILTRGGISQPVTLEQLAAYFGGTGYPSLALSAITFQTGAAVNAVLATISAPVGWTVAAETTFGGRIAVSPDGTKLLAARVETLAVAGSARLRAVSPDGLRTIIETFPLAYELAPVVAPPIPIGIATGLLHALPLARAA